ncbi:MAG: hypothetical protein IT328_26280 [Caldilineaceae bacterium]|nr:hypothetical protein [Caldilineaceae bacterium]
MTTRSLARRWLWGLANWVWHWLRRPWLAIMAGLIGLMLAIAVLQLPQLPGQLVDEQAAAASWLLNTSTAYGIWGNLLLALGLFDVLRSPLLFLLLALLLPTVAAQLADQLGALRQLRAVQSYPLTTPAAAPGEAIPIVPVRPLYRWRGIVHAKPEVVASLLESKFAVDFPDTTRVDVPLLAPTPPVAETENAEEPAGTETRLLGTRFPRLLLLRPLLMVGLLMAVIGAWVALAFGWQVTAPPLAPGETFRSANRNLVLHYSVAMTGTLSGVLETSIQGDEIALPTERATRQRAQRAMIQVRPTYPGLWIATSNGSARLTLPGDAKLRPSVGLVFASPGSEESILIPDQGAGLRIVQKATSNDFVLELYRSDTVQPVYRAELTQGGRLSLPFDPRDAELVISTMPGLQVDVRYLPGLWLVWFGLVLVLAGGLAFLRPTAFVLAQVAPWTPAQTAETTVVVLQSDHSDTIAGLRAILTELTPSPETSETGEESNDEPSPLQPSGA